MRRGWKIAIGIVAAFVVLLGVNALIMSAETAPAEVTEPGGRILELPGGDLQVVDRARRGGSPIVLIHGFTAAIDWWDRMTPRLVRDHRVVAIDLLGHGGSEKPSSGYSISNQADLVAQALDRLEVSDATVVGHSLGGPVAVALAERSPQLVESLVLIDSRSSKHDNGGLGFLAGLAFAPVIGEALWRIKPNFSVRDGLKVGFAPGFDFPDAFVEDIKRVTYSAFEDMSAAYDDYVREESLAERVSTTGKPALAIMGAEEQIVENPRAVLAAYEAHGAQTVLVDGAGHSPIVERPALTAGLVLDFAAMQERVQKKRAVRNRP